MIDNKLVSADEPICRIIYAADIVGVRLIVVVDVGVGGVDVQVVRVGAIVLGS